MELSQEIQFHTDQLTLWNALNNVDILQKTIPGVEKLTQDNPNEFVADVSLKIGMMKANYQGRVVLSDINAPHSYTISGSGKSKIAGEGTGSAQIELIANDAGTLLKYTASAKVSGKIAQLGSRLIDATAKKLAEEFFQNLKQELSA